MRTQMNDAVQVAARRARIARFSLPGQANGGAVVHAGRHIHVDGALGVDAAVAAAVAARVGDDLAAAATGPAGLLNAKESLALNDDALSLATPARRRLAAAASAAAGALAADFFTRNRHALDHAARRFRQVQLD